MEKVKNIGIDARFFGPEDKGFGRYVENLVKNLEKVDSSEEISGKNHYLVFLNKKRSDKYQPLNQNFKKIPIGHNSFWPFKIDKKMYKNNTDIMHFTCLPPPFFYNHKFVLTVHDFTWKIFPPFKNPIKKIIYSLLFKRAIKKAEKIISVSEYTRKDILKFYKINPGKIEVIYEGIS